MPEIWYLTPAYKPMSAPVVLTHPNGTVTLPDGRRISKEHTWATRDQAVAAGLERLAGIERAARRRLARVERHRQALLASKHNAPHSGVF